MQATAVQNGDEWVINGNKWFTSGASRAAFTTVFAKTDPEAEKHLQVQLDPGADRHPRYLIQRAVPTMGHVGGQHCEVVYDDVRVPYANLLGQRGAGFLIAQKRLGPGRIFHCMRWLGQAERAFELMCDRALNRYAHGSMLAEKGAIQTMNRRVRGRDPGGAADDARRRARHGRRLGGPGRDQPHQIPRSQDAQQRDRPRRPGPRRARRHQRHAARQDVREARYGRL